jgi:hypothetical protein
MSLCPHRGSAVSVVYAAGPVSPSAQPETVDEFGLWELGLWSPDVVNQLFESNPRQARPARPPC